MTRMTPGALQGRQRASPVTPTRGSLPTLIVGTAILIAFGGGTHPLTLGLLTIAVGLAIALRPPDHGIGGLAGLCWIALFTWMLLSLCWPATSTEWRLAAGYLGIDVGNAVTPQRWVTVEALTGFLAGSAILILALANPPDVRQRRQCTRLLASTLVILGAAAIIAESLSWRLPWASDVHVFSWFPNRNQTALTFACGSVLLFGLALEPWYRQGAAQPSRDTSDRPSPIKLHATALSALLCGCLLLYAVFQSLSRGAVIAWCCGMLALAILGATHSNRSAARLLRLAPAAIILLFSFFVFWGGDSRDRIIDTLALNETSVADTAVPADFRWQIYSDTVSMIAEQPLTGVGLGQFHYVFPHYRTLPAAPVGILHPENDWLWWTAELGAVGLSLIIVGIGSLLFRLSRRNSQHREALEPNNAAEDLFYRHIALAALIPFFAHSLVDVGAHRLGTVSLAILLYALALPQCQQATTQLNFTRHLWRSGGVALLAIGIALLSLATLKSPLLTTYAPTEEQPLPTAPLQWQPYFRLAVQTYPDDRQAALNMFYQARFLQPDNADIPLYEGLFLLRMNDHGGAFAAFSSAIQRSHEPTEPFRQILRRTASQPIHHKRLHSLAQTNEDLIAAYWCAVPAEMLESAQMMDDLNSDWPTLGASAQQSILENLGKRRFTDKVHSLFNASQTDKQKQTWPIAMRTLVAADRWEEALAIFDQWAGRKPLPCTAISDDALRQLQTNALIHAEDPAAASRLITAYLSRNMWEEVRRTAERARSLPGSPPDTLYWLGRALAETNRRQEAAHAYAEWLAQGEPWQDTGQARRPATAPPFQERPVLSDGPPSRRESPR